MRLFRVEVGSFALSAIGFLLAVAIAVGIGVFGGLRGPFPVTILLLLPFLLAFVNLGWGLLAVLALFATLYFGWIRPAFTGRVQFTKFTWSFFAVLVLLSIAHYQGSWAFGITYQGRAYTLGCFVVGAMLLSAVVVMGLVGRRRGSNDFAVVGRWLGLVWMVTYGFPILGEVLP